VDKRNSDFDVADPTSGPPIPDWDQLQEYHLHDDAVPPDPDENAVVLESVDPAVMNQLSDLEKEMLKSLEERWAQFTLPAQLKSQKLRKKASKTGNRWASKLKRAWLKGQSKHWQNLKQLGAGKPVPSSKKRKGKEGADAPPASESSSLPTNKRQFSKGAKGSQASSMPQASLPSAPGSADLELVQGSPWQGVEVRTVDDKMASWLLNRTWTVTEVRRSKSTGVVHLRLQDAKLAVGYCTESQVVPTSKDAGCTPPGHAVINYRQFGKSQRVALAKQLNQDVALIQSGELLESQTLEWALKEVQVRLPASGVAVVTSVELLGILGMATAAEAKSESDQLAWITLKTRLEGASLLLVLVHSEGPSHYTLLTRQAVSGWGA